MISDSSWTADSSLQDSDPEVQAKIFSDLAERSDANFLFVFSTDGTIVFASDASIIGANPAAVSLMTQDNINHLMQGTYSVDGAITPVIVKNQNGTFYFYSKHYTFAYNMYTIVVGEDASVLDAQIASLTDYSTVLSRTAVSNDGFLFAADKTDKSFLYYVNGDEILSGQSFTDCGLSEKALEDGYIGFETIKGKRYYCISRSFGGDTVICSATEADKIVANDRSVLRWSVLGFVYIMILCLAYAVIVRNDFVRKAVETRRITLNPRSHNPSFFDITLFKKIFPLMLLGFIAIWGISFYTQTLLEITQVIGRSDAALTEIIGRYEDNTVNQKTVQDYYDKLFLAKARLIAFLIEEDPSVLNAETDHYYSSFDDSGNKQFFLDNEGNPLRSVSSSRKFQDLCDANNLESIFVFDEVGHTIATSTADWFYTISNDAEDASSGFFEILEERAVSKILETAVGSEGTPKKYIGVALRYYTSVNENKETVYVSRFAYEEARNGQNARRSYSTLGDITPHRSMILIAPDSSLSDRVMESTDTGTILSSTTMAGGIIFLFDSSEEHRCVYSPIESAVGKTAADLNFSSKAFGEGNYYGFNTLNATDYFQFTRFSNGYYISLMLPVSTMYQLRMPISINGHILTAIADQQGYFEDEGIKVEYVEVDTDTEVFNGIKNNTIDVASTSGTNLPLQQISEGLDLTIFGGYLLTGCLPVFARVETRWHSIDDFIGKTVAWEPNLYAISGPLLDMGYDPLNQINWYQPEDQADRITAVKNGEADYGLVGTALNYEINQDPELKIITYAADVLPGYSCCRAEARTEWIEKNPGTVKGLLKAWIRAMAYYETHRDETVSLVAKLTDRPEAAVRAYLNNPRFELNPDPMRSSVERAWDYMSRLGLFDEQAQNISIDDHINTDIYKAALDECQALYGSENPDFYERMQTQYAKYDGKRQ